MQYFNDSSGEDADEAGYELLVPFVCVESAGGPYDDESFTHGFQVGRLWEELRPREPMSTWFVTELEEQLALVAGHHRMVLSKADIDDDASGMPGMALYRFTPMADLEAELADVVGP